MGGGPLNTEIVPLRAPWAPCHEPYGFDLAPSSFVGNVESWPESPSRPKASSVGNRSSPSRAASVACPRDFRIAHGAAGESGQGLGLRRRLLRGVHHRIFSRVGILDKYLRSLETPQTLPFNRPIRNSDPGTALSPRGKRFRGHRRHGGAVHRSRQYGFYF